MLQQCTVRSSAYTYSIAPLSSRRHIRWWRWCASSRLSAAAAAASQPPSRAPKPQRCVHILSRKPPCPDPPRTGSQMVSLVPSPLSTDVLRLQSVLNLVRLSGDSTSHVTGRGVRGAHGSAGADSGAQRGARSRATAAAAAASAWAPASIRCRRGSANLLLSSPSSGRRPCAFSVQVVDSDGLDAEIKRQKEHNVAASCAGSSPVRPPHPPLPQRQDSVASSSDPTGHAG